MLKDNFEAIITELHNCFDHDLNDKYDELLALIKDAHGIFVSGLGRTGYVMRCFSMRLMQAGYNVYWIGDNNTPRAGDKDVLILGSGSGETDILTCYMKNAKQLHMRTAVFTASRNSSLSLQADVLILLKASTKYEKGISKASIQPMGSLFEQELLIFLDAFILSMLEYGLISENTMQQSHANLE